jgi:hypothetical protein
MKKLTEKQREEIVKAFWDGIPDGTTWEELNKGMTIKFTYKGTEYRANTHLGNYWQLGVDGYQRKIESEAVSQVMNKKI